MASHQFAIAKASFSAGLLRPDPISLSREDIAQFHSLLNEAVLQCSPKNVQKCKNWILQNITQSTARCTALGKYLTALAISYNEPTLREPAKREPSIKRKRLHLLYLLNDLLNHAKFHINDASISSKIQPILVSLLSTAASFKGCPKHQRKIADLLQIWEDKGFYSSDYIDKLRETVKNAQESGAAALGETVTSADGIQDGVARAAKNIPYVMPAMHGDTSTSWFDLPAGNMMPHIVPNSTRPINPSMIKPLQFVAGPADEGLALAVKTLLEDVQKIYGGETSEEEVVLGDIDELGQPIIMDEITGDVLEGEGYYGWSRSFCEKMKQRRKGGQDPVMEHRSRSRSSSPEQRKRRYSDSDDASVVDRGRRQRRRSYSSSRSPSTEDDRRVARNGNGNLRSQSRTPQRSPSSSSRAPPNTNFPPLPTPPAYPNPQMMFSQGMNHNFPPPPPPLPFNNQGPPYGNWIPPPPPIDNTQFNGQQFNQHWPPPPPPPPMVPMPPGGWQGQQNQGRGHPTNAWQPPPGPQGRGGRGNYRGRGW
ncbi:hypothetical protein BP6252_00316 [Coleophoma cylindrospora]|uniref:CID domain-containing protein n=1 Tax=Coleophoma cylindrospora TaxID=1849047 RepID=A0A3D8SQ20_9HELO|nr:hypothetical protein BP6252_00316 [Coleophoma cylindrospora]